MEEEHCPSLRGRLKCRDMSPVSETLLPYSHLVITGGSSGIGKCFLSTISYHNKEIRICNLSRTVPEGFSEASARRQVSCDLAGRDDRKAGVAAVESWLEEEPPRGKILLINNAGFGSYGLFEEQELDGELAMMEVNCAAAVELTGRLLPRLREHGGAVVNVASTAAWQPTPYMAVYGATKAFLLQWSLALHAELKPAGIPVMALCPGPTESRFFERAGFEEPPLAGMGQSAQAVVDFALRKLGRGAACPVSGWTNKLLVAAGSRLPRAWQGPIAKAVLRRVRMDKR